MLVDIEYVMVNPSGNITALVPTSMPRELYVPVACRIMEGNNLGVEQVGFVERLTSGSCMEMMGGEFCGNASRGFGAWLLMGGREYLREGGAMLRPLPMGGGKVMVQVSGCSRPLEVVVEPSSGENCCFAEMEMPSPGCIIHGRDDVLGAYSLVEFAGISHGILWQREGDAALLPWFRGVLARAGLSNSCCGMMFVEEETPLLMRPLVYVEKTESLVWEQSCGSGSLAFLCALIDKTQMSFRRYPIGQPGGVLFLSGEYAPREIRDTRIAGEISFTGWGKLQIDL